MNTNVKIPYMPQNIMVGSENRFSETAIPNSTEAITNKKSLLSKIKSKIHQWTSDTQKNNNTPIDKVPKRTSNLPIYFIADRMNFSVTKAKGGFVVQYETVTPGSGAFDHEIYIIPEDADLEESIARIVSHQLLIK